MGRRDPNDGMGFVSGVASCVILLQETREFVAIEPSPAGVQVDEEFKFAAREDRHAASLADQARYRRHAGAVRKYRAGEYALVDP